MQNDFFPKVDLKGGISETKLSTFQEPTRLKRISDDKEIPEFKDVMSGMAKELNDTVKAPDQVMQDSLTGNADISDAMIAISKAEIGINIATQITTKVVQSYEKIMSIQI